MGAAGAAELAGRVGIVTGAGRGLGRAIALALADAGAHVALCARTRDQLAGTAAAVAAAGGSASVHSLDVTDEELVEGVVADVTADRGRLDFLVNNAGANVERPFAELSLAEWRSLLAVNLDGSFLCARAAVRRMDPAAGGVILNVASVFATSGVPGFSAYAASKAALLGLTRTLAVELAPRKVRVNALLPGHFATDMTSAALADAGTNARVVRAIPAGRVGDPDELGALARFLLSDAAAFVTGTEIVVDGGFSAR